MRLQHVSLLLVALLAGCIHTRNVTSSDHYQSDYEQGGLYELQQEADLQQREKRGWLDEAMLDRPLIRVQRPGYGSLPSVGTLATGTQLRFQRLVQFNYGKGTSILPVARITSGPHAGTQVDIHYISAPMEVTQGYAHHTRVDPAWLKPVDVSGAK